MTIIRFDDQPKFDVQRNHMIGLASPSRGAHELLTFRGQMDPGASSPPHIHDHEEAVVILAGSVQVRIGEEVHRLNAGDAFVVPPQTLHQVVNDGEASFDSVIAMLAGTRFIRPNGEETPPPPWTK